MSVLLWGCQLSCVIKFFYSLGVSNESTVSCSVDVPCRALKLVSRLLEAKKIERNFVLISQKTTI